MVGIGEEDEIARLQRVPAHRLSHGELLRHVVWNVETQGVVDDEHREPGTIEGPRALPGVDVGIALVLQGEVRDCIAGVSPGRRRSQALKAAGVP